MVSDLGSERCPEEASADGLCIFHNTRPDKDRSKFQKRLKELLESKDGNELWLKGCIFPDGISLEWLAFRSSVSFAYAKFYGRTTAFTRTLFCGEKTDFLLAEFHGENTSFQGTEFRSLETTFTNAQFRSHSTSFSSAIFDCERPDGDTATFQGADFRSKRTFFIDTQFCNTTTSFAQARFYGSVVFRGNANNALFLGKRAASPIPNHEESGSSRQTIAAANPKASRIGQTDQLGLDLAGIVVGEGAELTFDCVNLSRSRFLRDYHSEFQSADLTNVKFLDVTWDRDPKWWKSWRCRLYDEAIWRKKRLTERTVDTVYLPHLARLYRSIKAYYHKSGEHRLSGHFNYGLMEIEWYQKGAERTRVDGDSRFDRARSWLRSRATRWVSREALYRYSCGYGEDYRQAVLVLFLLVLVFGGWYWGIGVPLKVAGDPWWKSGLRSLMYSVQTASLGRIDMKLNKPPSLGSDFPYVAESILVPAQVALFILVLRNRFRQ